MVRIATPTTTPLASRTTAHHIGCSGRGQPDANSCAALCVTDAMTLRTTGSAASRSPATLRTAAGSSKNSTLCALVMPEAWHARPT
jgi:hypothetical protein